MFVTSPVTTFLLNYCDRGWYMHYTSQSFSAMAHWGKYFKNPSSKMASSSKQKELCFVLKFWIPDISPNCISSLLTMHNWPLHPSSYYWERQRKWADKQNDRNRMRTDFAEKRKNSGNPNMTNTGAAGQKAIINLHEVSLFSLLMLHW